MLRDSVSKNEVMERIKNQMSDIDKLKLADYAIINDSEQSLLKQVYNIHEQLLRL